MGHDETMSGLNQQLGAEEDPIVRGRLQGKIDHLGQEAARHRQVSRNVVDAFLNRMGDTGKDMEGNPLLQTTGHEKLTDPVQDREALERAKEAGDEEKVAEIESRIADTQGRETINLGHRGDKDFGREKYTTAETKPTGSGNDTKTTTVTRERAATLPTNVITQDMGVGEKLDSIRSFLQDNPEIINSYSHMNATPEEIDKRVSEEIFGNAGNRQKWDRHLTNFDAEAKRGADVTAQEAGLDPGSVGERPSMSAPNPTSGGQQHAGVPGANFGNREPTPQSSEEHSIHRPTDAELSAMQESRRAASQPPKEPTKAPVRYKSVHHLQTYLCLNNSPLHRVHELLPQMRSQ